MQPDLVQDVPAHSRRVGIGLLSSSLPTRDTTKKSLLPVSSRCLLNTFALQYEDLVSSVLYLKLVFLGM